MTPSIHVATAIILVVASLFITPSFGVTKQILSLICSQTQNDEICENILLSDPRTASADLPLLSPLISIELTMKQVDNNYDAFSQWRDNSTDPALRDSYGNCVKIYQNMEHILQEDYELSHQKQYKDMHDLGALTTFAYNCENGLPSSSPTAAITEDMLLVSETVTYTDLYIASRT